MTAADLSWNSRQFINHFQVGDSTVLLQVRFIYKNESPRRDGSAISRRWNTTQEVKLYSLSRNGTYGDELSESDEGFYQEGISRLPERQAAACCVSA